MALSPAELRLLDLALARVMPVEDDETVRAYVRDRAALQPDLYRTLLMLLQARSFEALSQPAQEAVLAEMESHPSFLLLAQHAVEGYYTSPAGMAEVGFRVTA